ncbi:MAG: hypothetical protein AB7R55_01815 [Gemmatimonadales bacterium]
MGSRPALVPLVVALLLASAAPTGAATAQDSALAGRWALNPERTDAPNRPAAREDGARIDSVPAYGGLVGSSPTALRAMFLMRPPRTVAIGATATRVTLRVEGRYPLTLQTDWKKVADTLPDGQRRISRARWKRDRLEVESMYADVARVTETYRLDRESGALLVEARIRPESLRKTVTLRRVYGRAG